ncbi:MAG: alpha/beta fold hydrolase [Ilumatobacteraceae bacterium]
MVGERRRPRRSFPGRRARSRGHGHGIRSAGTFSLAECADDVAALVRAWGVGPVVVVGYSMGGPIAQLVWRRHPDLVAGAVLCSTADVFAVSARDRRMFGVLDGLAAAARVGSLRHGVERVLRPRCAKARTRAPGAQALEQIARHDWFAVLEAGRALGRHDRSWLGRLDGPSAVVVTTADEVVPADRQRAMARRLTGRDRARGRRGTRGVLRPGVVRRRRGGGVPFRGRAAHVGAARSPRDTDVVFLGAPSAARWPSPDSPAVPGSGGGGGENAGDRLVEGAVELGIAHLRGEALRERFREKLAMMPWLRASLALASSRL